VDNKKNSISNDPIRVYTQLHDKEYYMIRKKNYELVKYIILIPLQ